MRIAGFLLAVLLAVMRSGAASAESGHWLKAEGSRFIVYGEESESVLRQAVLDLENYDETMSVRTGLHGDGPAPKLSVYLVHDLGALSEAMPDIPKQVDGFYLATAEIVGAMAVFKSGGVETLFHEYAHHFMKQHSPMAYPLWYVEGFAEYFAPTRFKADTVELGVVPDYRAFELVFANWLPFRAILFGNLWGIPPAQRSQFYGQSWLLTHYLFSSPERLRKLHVYLEKVNDGVPSVTAFRDSFGEEPEALDTALRDYVKAGLAYYRVPRPQPAGAQTVTVTPLSRAYDDLILLDFRMRADASQEWGQQTLEEVRRRAGAYRDDSYAQRVLARAEIFYGQPAAGEALAEAALAAQPNDPDWLYLKGIALLRRGAQTPALRLALFRQGRQALALANRVRPNDVPTLYRYARSFVVEPGEPSENTANTLYQAMTLSPQIDELVVTTCYALMKRGDFAPAARYLKTVANAPHSEKLAETSRRLLRFAEQGRAPDSNDPVH